MICDINYFPIQISDENLSPIYDGNGTQILTNGIELDWKKIHLTNLYKFGKSSHKNYSIKQ